MATRRSATNVRAAIARTRRTNAARARAGRRAGASSGTR